ncbi:MAG TPA: isochorismatase family cysteine hydrolase [Clostridia bacterium]|nr:isochorismatase family cysteine hydrolase [Clostridia bacterium]
MNRIFIVVDMQNDFITGTLGSDHAKKIVPRVAQKIEEARKRGDHIIYTQDTHEESYLESFEGKHLPVSHCIRGSEGIQIYPSLTPKEGEIVLEKPTFGSVELPGLLKHYINPDTVIELCGVCTDICVVSNAILLRAHYPNNEIVVEAAACAGVTPESHDAALTTMRACQISVE